MMRPGWMLLSTSVLICGCGKEPAKVTSPPPPAIAANRPALEVLAGDGQLGTADFGDRCQCTFSLRNNTQQPMHLSVADKSCSCAGARLDPEQVEPGQSSIVTLLWTPKAEVLETTTTRLWTDIRDQSGSSVRLEATGILEPKVQFAFPRGPLDFGRLDPAELDSSAKTLVVEAYSTRGPFQISTLRSNVGGIELVIPAEPLSADRLAQLHALAGYRISLKPTKGLPTGQFRGHLLLVSSFSPQTLELPLTGAFETGVISLSHDRVDLPPRLNLRQAYRVPAITLTVRHGTCSTCEVQSITPALFNTKVSRLGEKSWRIELTLPEGLDATKAGLTAEQWNDLLDFGFDQGVLTLKLDHPEVKSLQIPISGTQLGR